MKRKFLIIGLSSFVLVCLTLYFVTPIVFKNYLLSNSEKLLGRSISIKSVSPNIFTGRYTFKEFIVFEKDGTTPFVSCDEIVLRTSVFSLLFNHVRFDEISLVGTLINIEQNGHIFNFSDILQFLNDKQDSEKDIRDVSEAEKTKSIELQNISFKNCSINYFDKSISKQWQLKQFSFKIPELKFSDIEQTNFILEVDFAEGGAMKSNLDFRPDKKTYKLNVDITDFNLSQILPYVEQSLKLKQISGIANVNLLVLGATEHILDVNISGKANFKNVDVINSNKVLLGQIVELNADISKLDIVGGLYLLDNVDVNGLDLFVEIDEKGTNFDELLKSSDGEKSEIKFDVKNIKLENSSMNIADNTFNEEFKFGVDNISINSSRFSLTGKNNIKLEGDFPSGGRLIASWEGFFDKEKNQKFFVTASNLNLNQFSPYSVHYLGYEILEGTMSVNIRNNVVNKQSNGLIELDIYLPRVGEKQKNSKPVLNIPLRSALTAFKDKNNKISLQIPFDGSVDSPDFSYKKIVKKQLLAYGGRLLSAPISSLFKVKESDDLLFNMLAIDFSPEEFNKIRNIAKQSFADLNTKIKFIQYFNLNKYKDYFDKLEPDPKQSEQLLQNRYEQYNKNLVKYLKQNRLNETRFVVETAPFEELKNYDGESKYVISVYSIN